MPLTTTLKRLLEKRASDNASRFGWKKLLAGLGKTEADSEKLPFSLIAEINGIHDAIWACRAEPRFAKEWRLYAVWCARQVQHLLKDERSLKALEVAERAANGTATKEELRAAYYAARDATSDRWFESHVAGRNMESAWQSERRAASLERLAANAGRQLVGTLEWKAAVARERLIATRKKNARNEPEIYKHAASVAAARSAEGATERLPGRDAIPAAMNAAAEAAFVEVKLAVIEGSAWQLASNRQRDKIWSDLHNPMLDAQIRKFLELVE